MEFRAKFKCRLCKKEFNTVITGNHDLAFSIAAQLTVNGTSVMAQAPCMTQPHCCLDGSIGIADFLGWEYKGEEQRHFTKL